jgi:hypothetical protein
MLAEFNTLGQFDNGIEKALLGQINATISGKGGTEGYLALVDSLTALRRENIEALAHRVGWDAAIHMAGQQVEGTDRNRAYYQYANSEDAERNFRANKPVFDDVKTAVGYIVKDIANTLWGQKLPFLGVTGREVGVGVANVLG